MADRTVSVELQAKVAGFIANMRTAGKSVSTAFATADTRIRKNRESLNGLGTALGVVGIAAAVGVGKAIKSFADFDSAMSSVQAATHESARNMNLLRDAALDAGARTVYSATESAGAIEALAKAGVTTADILSGGLDGALDLAAAGSLDVGEAAEIAATAMTQFRLSGEKIPHLADLLAAGAGKAQGEVTDLGMALKQSGLVAAQFGLGIEETVGTLSAFASAGLLGSDAGTSFKTMLLQLGNPTAKSAKLMKRLGIDTYDAKGNFIGIAGLAGELQKELKDLTPAQRNAALATIFGSDALRAANVLYKQGEKGIQGWISKVNDSGYASETAATKLDNLKGDLEALSGSVETAFIKAGSGADQLSRSAVQSLTEVVNAFAALPPETQKTVLATTALVGATALAGAGLLKTIIVVQDARAALEALTGRAITARGALAALAGVGVVLGAAIGAVELTKMLGRANVAKVQIDDLGKSLSHFGSSGKLGAAGIKLFDDRMQLVGNQIDTTGEALEKFEYLAETAFGDTLTAKIDRFTDMGKSMEEIKGIAKQLDPALTQLAEIDPSQAAGGFKRFADILKRQGASQAEINALFPKYTAAVAAASASANANAAAHRVVDAAMRGETVSAARLNAALKQLAQGSLGTEQANIAFRQSINGIAAAADANGRKLHGNSTAALANRQALVQAAQSAVDFAAAVEQSTGSATEANRTLAASRDVLVNKVAKAFGISKKAASDYVAEILGIPKMTRTKLEADKRDAESKLRDVKRQLQDPNLTKTRRAKLEADKRQLERQVNAAQRKLDSLKDKTVTLTVRQRTLVSRSLIDDGRTRSGFSTGGYTGLGGKNEPAGVVHRREYVIPNVGPAEARRLDALYGGGGSAAAEVPGHIQSKGFVKLGEVSDKLWDRLLAEGWKGRAGDRMEALYPPAMRQALKQDLVRGFTAAGGLSGGGGGVQDIDISVFIGNKEITDIVKVVVREDRRDTKRTVTARAQ